MTRPSLRGNRKLCGWSASQAQTLKADMKKRKELEDKLMSSLKEIKDVSEELEMSKGSVTKETERTKS